VKLKWEVSGKGDEAWGSDYSQYEGPTPPKGSYVARVKRITVDKIKAKSENYGKPRLNVLLELVGGSTSNGLDDPNWEYLGAPIWDGLNIIKSGTGRVNAFLHALTDGSDAAKRAVETAFWPPNGPDAKAEDRRDGGKDVHIKKIGGYLIGSPNGQHLVRVVTKMGTNLEGVPRAEVNNYLPYTGPRPEAATNGTNGKVADDGIVDEDDSLMDASEYLDSVGDDDDVVVSDVVADDGPPF
jgi:hypothetical protein